MQEQLTLHQVEGEVVQSPAEHVGANLIVESLKGGVGIVVAASLPAQDGNALEDNPSKDSHRRRPPDDGVTEEVNLRVGLTPEVDTSAEDGPGLGAGIPGVGVGEAGVGLPHDLLQLPELSKEARAAVVDLFDVVTELRVLVVLDVPETVGERAAAGTSHLLLLRGPVRELHLVGEENAASHDVDETELGLDGSQTLLGNAG